MSKALGEKVRETRAQWGVSLGELAAEDNRHKSLISREERGLRPIDSEAAQRLCDAVVRIAAKRYEADVARLGKQAERLAGLRNEQARVEAERLALEIGRSAIERETLHGGTNVSINV